MLRDQEPAAISRDLATVRKHDAVDTSIMGRNPIDRSMLIHLRTGRLRGDSQSCSELAVVDLMVLGRQHRTGELAGKMRLAAPRFRRRDPLQRQAELLLKGELMVEPRLVVRSQGNDQRTLAPQFHVDAGRFQQFRGKCGPTRLALTPELDQSFLARLGLGAGRQHPGGGMARAGARRATVEDRNRGAACRQAPSDAQPNDAGANNGDVRFVGGVCEAARQPAAPFAGMTQTGSWV
jgi:hypothetical protein